MTELFSWLPIILIFIIIIIIIGLSCWYRQGKKKLQSIDHLSSIKDSTFPINSSQLTNTDKAYLDKIVRTASDRSMWKRDNSKKNEQKKILRKIPSGLIEGKS
jgi:hypothetical protein